MPTVDTNGIETYYERHGEGPPIVFIHGSGWDHRSWAPQVEALAEEYELITYDVRGHGKTSASNRNRVTMDVLVDDLETLIDVLELANPAIVGLSMGGAIAHTFAATYPDTLRALVVVEGPTSIKANLSLRQRILYRLNNATLRILGPRRAYRLYRWYMDRGSNTEPTNDVEIESIGMTKQEYLTDAASRRDKTEYPKLLRGLVGFQANNLSAISVPTLVVTGADPHPVLAEAAETMQAAIPDVRTREISEAGHAVNIDNPEAFNRTLRQFLSDIETGTS